MLTFNPFLALTLCSTFWALTSFAAPSYSMSVDDTPTSSTSLMVENAIGEPTLLEQLPEQSEPITSVALSPTGNFVVSGSADSTLQLWDLRAQRVMRTLHSHTAKVTSLMFSPNGRMLVSGSRDKTIKIWNLAMVRLKLTIYTDSEIHSVAVSPHGQTFASGNSEGTVEIWNLNTGKKRRQFRTPINSEVRVTYSPDGKMLATSYPDRAAVHFWDPLTGELLATQSEPELSAESECNAWWNQKPQLCGAIAATPKGQLLADIDRQQILLWRLPETIQFTATTPLLNLHD